MNIIFSTLIAIIIILLLVILAASFVTRLERHKQKHKKEFFEKAIDRVSSLIRSNIVLATDLQKPGPWYLVVYTKDSDYPIWISNNNIRSVHPDPEHCKIIVKQFNGEDMVIDNVMNYELCSGSELCNYDM